MNKKRSDNPVRIKKGLQKCVSKYAEMRGATVTAVVNRAVEFYMTHVSEQVDATLHPVHFLEPPKGGGDIL